VLPAPVTGLTQVTVAAEAPVVTMMPPCAMPGALMIVGLTVP
jgi:hypothetical protein